MNKLTLKDIPLNDPYVYKYIGTGNTEGIFQIESPGMQDLMKKMFADVPRKIDNLEKKYYCKGFKEIEYYGDEHKSVNMKEKYIKAMETFGNELTTILSAQSQKEDK